MSPADSRARRDIVRRGRLEPCTSRTLNGTVYGLDARSGQVLWRRELGARVSTSIAIVGNDAYAGDENGRVHRLDARTGVPVTTLPTDGNVNFKLVPVGESLLVFASAGRAVIGRLSVTRSRSYRDVTLGVVPYVLRRRLTRL